MNLLDNFNLKRPLGSGLSGEVVLAERDGNSYALKFLKPSSQQASSLESIRSFKEEFSILKGLSHPHIAKIHDFAYDEKSKRYYYSSEYIEGKNLYDATLNLESEKIEALFIQSLRALEYLHSHAIYHFDLKPQNILVNSNHSLKLIDFGLAGFKPKGAIAGTPAYMSPEIVLEEKPDGRADLYSLGIVFYECLTRHNPFRAASLSESLRLQQNLTPLPVSEKRRDLPEYWNHILAKLLRKNPRERYSHASAVIHDLNQRAHKNYSLETPDTLLAYLPGEGIFINRKLELEAFKKAFDLFSQSPDSHFKKTILLTGPSGIGKSRLLKEFRFYAQLRNAKVLSYENQIPEDLNSSLVLIADSIDSSQFQKLLDFSASYPHPLLIVGASLEDFTQSKEHLTWPLSAFSENEVKEYLVALTGFSDPPAFLIDEITQRSEGNPLFLFELVKKLIQNGMLLDKSGRWKASTYEDLEIDFSKIGIPENIQDFLKSEYDTLNNEEKEIAEKMAVWAQAVNIFELEKFCNLEKISLPLQKLLEKGILEKDEKKQQFNFTNPQFPEVILKSLPVNRLESSHLKIAKAIESEEKYRLENLYHLGRSGLGLESAEALQQLGETLMQLGKIQEAKKNFEIAYRNTNLSSLQKMEIGLQWGDTLLKNSEVEAAGKLFEKIRKELTTLQPSPENKNAQIEVLEKLGAVYLKRQQPLIAEEIFNSTLEIIDPSSKVKILILKNYLGRAKLAQGKQGEALQIFLASDELWKKELNAEEKKQVLNNDLASVYQLTQAYPQALSKFEEDLKFYESLPHLYLMARTHYHLAEVNAALKNTAASVRSYQACIELSKNHHFYDLLLRAYNGLGNLLNIHKDYEGSSRYYERALTLSQKIQDLNSQAAICTNLGIIYNETGQIESAFPQVHQAIFLLERIKQKTAFQIYFLIRAKIEMADILRKFKKFEEATMSIEDALLLIQEHSHQSSQAFWARCNLAKIYVDQGRKEEAMKEYQESKTLSSNEDAAQQKELTLIKKMLGESELPSLSESVSSAEKVELSSNQDPIEKGYEYLFQLNHFLNAEHNLDFLLKTILNYALDLSGAERALVLLLNNEQELEIKASLNIEISSNLSEISSNIAQKVLQSGQYVETDDATDDARFNEYQSVLILQLRSILCLPIHSRNRTVGVLYLDNRYRPGAFKKTNLKVLQAFCDQAGIAIENTKLINQYENVQKKLQEKLAKAEDEASTYQAILKEESINLPTKYSYEKIIAQSKAMYNIFKLLDKITETQLSVFIHGETGTGKELIAKALHYNNKIRNENRFVALNCGAIPANLMESELFGHKAGSFTGAMKDKKGLFAEANGGSLFLDEIAELDLNLQVKLLRVLEAGEYTPVGETKSFSCDVRIVAASHRNLEQLVKEGKFREDLFYRICQIKLDLPPLRERKEDIPLLADKFIEIYRKQHGVEQKLKIAPSFMRKMLEYDWPGNVRELENVISVTTALSENNELTYESLPASYGMRRILESKAIQESLQPEFRLKNEPMRRINIDGKNNYDPMIPWKEYEKLIVAKAYQSLNSNPAKTAEALDLSVATFYKRIKDFDLNNPSNLVYQNAFQYRTGLTLQDYVKKIFMAAHEYSDKHPYTAIKWLGVSQGYYYKIIKS